ncbi:MAG: DUF4181 domain-containing protein [Candidatus Pristimantibacillus lignocellulolyticus]|uniref:DUF4181 domain-containing protein n=1 Tax=Candidatus Pristimantibacillus lignocellulolyticus TaxID=2994561 RepID=A0A9J6ZHL9_9BACL|nr:MAG: DUF4181 domain-containing protein [Candidatus Pristimantibacillus lignocellulolyticus]
MTTILLISLFLTLTHWILRKEIVDTDREELTEAGKKVNMWGKIILVTIGFITVIILFSLDELYGDVMKRFIIIFIIMALGFQTFIDWKFLKGTREYIVSLIVLILGVNLVYFLY